MNAPVFNESTQNNQELPPDNYLVWGILTTLLCCLPLGVVSIVYASKVNGLWMTGHKTEAIQAAKNAKTWALVSCGVAIVLWILYLLSIAIFGVSMFEYFSALSSY